MSYGLPYMGSKSRIVEWVLSYIPRRENFYDLFCGGCAVTHAAILSRKFKNYHINDIQGDVAQLFVDAINGKYRDEKRWISREDFFRLKDTDAFVRYVWSFGNKGDTYIYGQDVEPYKRALHKAMLFGDYSEMQELGLDLRELGKHASIDEKMRVLKQILKSEGMEKRGSHYYKEVKNGVFVSAECLGSLERLQRIQNLNLLKNLSRTERVKGLGNLKEMVTMTKGSYTDVEIKPNSVLYCDIPYKGTGEYVCGAFNHEAFYDWCEKQEELVIVSEYDMPRERFECVAQTALNSTLSSTSNNVQATERLFVPKHQIDMYRKRKESQLAMF